MNQDEVSKVIQNLIDHCLGLTLKLVRLNRDTNEVEGVASGFLCQHPKGIYLISAGHALKKEGWVIETTLTDETNCRTACIPIGGAWTIKGMSLHDTKIENIDVGWAKIDMQAFKQDVEMQTPLKGKSFEYQVYQGPLDEEPNPLDPHLYASMNRVLLHGALGRTYLERECSYEYEMEFKGSRAPDNLYVFSIPKHKGHDYYRGASGSPIVEPSGKIRGILVEGCEDKNELYAYPMKGLFDLISIGNDVS